MRGNRWLTSVMAANDLAGRREWATTSAMIASIVIVTAVCLASYALVLGNWRVERARIDRDAWSLVLRVGNSVSTRGAVTPAVLAKLKSRLDAELKNGNQLIRAIHPYRTCRDRIEIFYYNDSNYDLVGRTIHFDSQGGRDLYLNDRKIQPGGKELISARDAGILLTPRALKKLGVETGEAPRTIDVEARATRQTIAILGILSEDLPDKYDFVISEAYERLLIQGDPSYSFVLTSPLPPAWLAGKGSLNAEDGLSIEQLPPALAERLESVELLDDQLRFQVRSYFDRTENTVRTELGLNQWKELLEVFAKTMFERTGIECAECKEPADIVDDSAAEEQIYDFVNVYVREAKALAPTADICDEVIVGSDGQGTVNRDVIAKLGSIDLRLQESIRTVNVQQSVIIAMSAFTLAVLQIFRALGKTREIGMLRAIGMKRRQVLAFVVIQSTLLSGLGASIGLAIGTGIAVLISHWTHSTPEDATLGVYMPYQLFLVISCGTFFVTLLSGFLAAWPWVLREPAKLMR